MLIFKHEVHQRLPGPDFPGCQSGLFVQNLLQQYLFLFSVNFKPDSGHVVIWSYLLNYYRSRGHSHIQCILRPYSWKKFLLVHEQCQWTANFEVKISVCYWCTCEPLDGSTHVNYCRGCQLGVVTLGDANGRFFCDLFAPYEKVFILLVIKLCEYPKKCIYTCTI